jgi:hypothetical protein
LQAANQIGLNNGVNELQEANQIALNNAVNELYHKGDLSFSEGCEASTKKKCTIDHNHTEHSLCEMSIDIEYNKLSQSYLFK